MHTVFTVDVLANPRAAVFFVALMPQFLRPDAHVRRTIDALTGTALIGLGVRLAATRA